MDMDRKWQGNSLSVFTGIFHKFVRNIRFLHLRSIWIYLRNH